MNGIDPRLAPLEPPYYVVDRPALRARFDTIRRAFEARFARLVIAYSYKTNAFPSVLRTLHAAGAWAEVVSESECRLARQLGVPETRIVFNGPVKSDAALERALATGTLLHLDNSDEVARVASIARARSYPDARVGLRVNLRHPEGEGHREFSRFGLTLAEIGAAGTRLSGAGLRVTSLHAHLATKARSLDDFRALVAALAEAAKMVRSKDLATLDVGGGFGHAPAEAAGRRYPSFEAYAGAIHEELARSAPELLDRTLVIEPGMAMVNDGVRFVTRVEAVKRIGGRALAVLDASIQTVKPTRHGLNLPARAFTAAGEAKSGATRPWDLVGYTCMDDDFIAVDQRLPDLERGDRIEIDRVGAYTAVFKPPFIRPMPAVYALDDDGVELDLPEQALASLHPGFGFGETRR
ncbi:MAG: alanine racemase [Myxococcota bacterium]